MKKFLIIPCLIIIIIFIYGFLINPNGFKIEESEIEIQNLPTSFDGFKIIQFSDILINSSKDIEKLNKIVSAINEIEPDIIVFSGDLVNSQYNLNKEEIIKIESYLSKLKCTLYKYAIIGDNDIKNKDIYINIMNDSDFIILDNASTYLFYKDITPIKITGLSDISKIDDALYLEDSLDTAYNIIITHYPDYIDEISNRNIDLVLAGHSLLGQVRVPFLGGIISKNLAKKYLDSYYEVNETKLYVSGGIGCEKINFRLFNKPVINLYRLKTN